MNKHVVRVSRDQIQSARALIRLSGGEDKVDPVIVRIAHARRQSPEELAAAKAQ